MNRIGVFTSGGDAPGMNACVRAVVRTALHFNKEIYGIYRGYEGMIDGDIKKLTSNSVSNTVHRGGTFLQSARSEEFRTKNGRKEAFKQISKSGIDGLIAIGGDGTFRGAMEFNDDFDIPIVGVPGTIDNDLFGTDFTIGYDTAVNTAVEAIDKIRDTANSHHRLFIVEVMGRDAGFIALRSGIGGGAECILIPESKTDIKHVIGKLKEGLNRQKTSSIVVVAEGDDAGGAFEVAKQVQDAFDFYDIRVTILGHLQRGGNPSAMDRVLASHLGYGAVKALLAGKTNIMVGKQHWEITHTPLAQATKHHQVVKGSLMNLSEILAN